MLLGMKIWARKIGLFERAGWYLLGKRHLCYSSLFEWQDDTRIPHPIYAIEDEAERNRWMNRSRELWEHLYQKHLKALPRSQRLLILAGKHPSQSHERIEEAESYSIAFSGHLASSGYSARVQAVRLQAGLLGLRVEFDEDPDGEMRRRLPDFFSGFQVKYRRPPEETVVEPSQGKT